MVLYCEQTHLYTQKRMEEWLVAVIVILCVGGCLATIAFGLYTARNALGDVGDRMEKTLKFTRAKFTRVNTTDEDTEGLSQSCHKTKFDNL